MVSLSLVFTESQHFIEFSPIMKVSFQQAKKRVPLFTCCDFKTFHSEIDFFFQLIFGCPMANLGPLLREQPQSPDVSHCDLTIST